MMKPYEENIRWAIDKHLNTISTCYKEIESLQQECLHGVVIKRHKSYDGYGEATEYYTDFKCSICDKYWTEKGSK